MEVQLILNRPSGIETVSLEDYIPQRIADYPTDYQISQLTGIVARLVKYQACARLEEDPRKIEEWICGEYTGSIRDVKYKFPRVDDDIPF